MHLIHIKVTSLEEFTGDPDQLEFKTFVGDDTPPYAILSHTWGHADDEVSWTELRDAIQKGPESEEYSLVTGKAGYNKIRWTCKQALVDGHSYAWIDTCCIDKDSSTELSRAINSMFYWYQHSSKCYAYLADIDPDEDHHEDSAIQDFRQATKSRWFTRGWTLQELIAPPNVQFYGSQWQFLGTRWDHFLAISEQTGINDAVLLFATEEEVLAQSVAARMSWASARETTQQEDEAYCLLGLFGVNMPLLYGERRGAFRRLQQEIFRRTKDTSIFAWTRDSVSPTLLAPSVRCFAGWGDTQPCGVTKVRHSCDLTEEGLRITTLLGKTKHSKALGAHVVDSMVYLRCEWRGLWVILNVQPDRENNVFRVDSLSATTTLPEWHAMSNLKLKWKTITIREGSIYEDSRTYHPSGSIYVRLIHGTHVSRDLEIIQPGPTYHWTSSINDKETRARNYRGEPFVGKLSVEKESAPKTRTIILKFSHQSIVVCLAISRFRHIDNIIISAAAFTNESDREAMLSAMLNKDAKMIFEREYRIVEETPYGQKFRVTQFSPRYRLTDGRIPVAEDRRLRVRIENSQYLHQGDYSIVFETERVPLWRQIFHRPPDPIHVLGIEAQENVSQTM